MVDLKTWTYPDGTEIAAETPEQADKFYQDYITQTVQEEYHNLPLGEKVGQTFKDFGRNFGNAASLGSLNQAISGLTDTPLEDVRRGSEEARIRQGYATLPTELLGYGALSRVLPSAVGPAMESIGGPTAVRALTGGTAAAVETGTLGGIQAGINDEDVAGGIAQGALAGPLGLGIAKGVNAAAPIVSRGYEAAKRAAKGVFDTTPSPRMAPKAPFAEAAPEAPPASPISATAIDEAATKAAMPDAFLKTPRAKAQVEGLLASAEAAANKAVAAKPTAVSIADLVHNAEKAATKAQAATERANAMPAGGKKESALIRAKKLRDEADSLRQGAEQAASDAAAMPEPPPKEAPPPAAPTKPVSVIAKPAPGMDPEDQKRMLADAQSARYAYDKLAAQVDEVASKGGNAKTLASLSDRLKQAKQKADRLEAAYVNATTPPEAAVEAATAPMEPTAPLKEALKASVKATPKTPRSPISAAPLGSAGAAQPGNLGMPKAKAPPKEKAAKPVRNARAESLAALDEAMANAQRESKGPGNKKYDVTAGEHLEALMAKPSFREGLTQDELDQIDQVIRGDPAVRAGRVAGRIMNPTTVLSGVAGGGILGTLGSHPILGGSAMVGIPALGMAARGTANAGTRKAVKDLLAKVRNEPPKKKGINPQTEKDIYNLVRLLGIGS